MCWTVLAQDVKIFTTTSGPPRAPNPAYFHVVHIMCNTCMAHAVVYNFILMRVR